MSFFRVFGREGERIMLSRRKELLRDVRVKIIIASYLRVSPSICIMRTVPIYEIIILCILFVRIISLSGNESKCVGRIILENEVEVLAPGEKTSCIHITQTGKEFHYLKIPSGVRKTHLFVVVHWDFSRLLPGQITAVSIIVETSMKYFTLWPTLQGAVSIIFRENQLQAIHRSISARVEFRTPNDQGI